MANTTINHANVLTAFTSKLSRLCKQKGAVRVQLRNGDTLNIIIMYDDNDNDKQIGFITEDHMLAWSMVGISCVDKSYDIVACDEITKLIEFTIDMDITLLYDGIKAGVITVSQFTEWVDNITEDAWERGQYSTQLGY